MGDAIRCRGAKICSPFVDGDVVYYVSSGTGEVFRRQAPDSHAAVAFTGGEPLGAQLDQSGRLHIADGGHGAVLRVDAGSSQPGVMVKAYEGRALRGPNGIAFSPDGALFTDSGPLGETTLEKPRGSVYCISPNPSGGQVLRPLALECLAHPWGIAASSDAVFVAETMRNRVLRLRARPNNAFHVSVFHQFAGGMGPSCAACDINGSLYVGHYDFAGEVVLIVSSCIGGSDHFRATLGGSSTHGKVSVLSRDGELLRTLEIPGTEITGLCLRWVASVYWSFLYNSCYV